MITSGAFLRLLAEIITWFLCEVNNKVECAITINNKHYVYNGVEFVENKREV